MRQVSAKVAVLLCAIAIAPIARAQSHQELIGAPVYAADGAEVGRVADVSSTGKEINALRVSVGMSLGLGERSVIIPQPAFMIRRGGIALTLFVLMCNLLGDRLRDVLDPRLRGVR